MKLIRKTLMLTLTVAVASMLTDPARAQNWIQIPGTPAVFVEAIKPATAKAPVIVMLHGGGGLDKDQVNAFGKWSRWLASLGVGTIIVDSFRGRGLQQFQSTGDRAAYMGMIGQRVGDLQRVVDWARSQSWIDPQRIAILGQSQGAIVATVAALETSLKLPQISFYNGCDARYFDNKPVPSAYPPSLWLSGAEDKVTPAANCEAVRSRMGAASQNTKLVVFPGATHTFDWEAPERVWNGNTLRYNAAADSASRTAIAEFLKAQRFIQ